MTTARPLTVAELIAVLSRLPVDAPVCASETTYTQEGEMVNLMPIIDVQIGAAGWGRNEGQQTVILRSGEHAWG